MVATSPPHDPLFTLSCFLPWSAASYRRRQACRRRHGNMARLGSLTRQTSGIQPVVWTAFPRRGGLHRCEVVSFCSPCSLLYFVFPSVPLLCPCSPPPMYNSVWIHILLVVGCFLVVVPVVLGGSLLLLVRPWQLKPDVPFPLTKRGRGCPIPSGVPVWQLQVGCSAPLW